MPITKEQATVLKSVIDQDANLTGSNLKLKNIPDYDEFYDKYVEQFKQPSWDSSSRTWTLWNNRKNRAWAEIVNKSLLPENVVGACVIGGFALAAMAAGEKVQLIDLFEDGGDSHLSASIPLYDVGDNTKKALLQFTGMTFEELLKAQDINDRINAEDQYIYNEDKTAMITNPFYGKSEKQVLNARRKALKAHIDSITI